MESIFKGFNKAVRAEKGVRSKRVLTPEKAEEGRERKLDLLRSGRTSPGESGKMLFGSPDKIVQEIIQALRFGADKNDIREACTEHKLLEAADWKAGRETIMKFAKERGVTDLTTVAHIFGLEAEDTHVVATDDAIAAE
jgi:hypothetical protein